MMHTHATELSTEDATFPSFVDKDFEAVAHTKRLKQNDSYTWKLVVSKLPPGEYELAVVFRSNDQLKGTTLELRSNVKRLDVLCPTAIPWNGLEVDLSPNRNKPNFNQEERALNILFKNVGEKALRFDLKTFGSDIDFTESLLCYDDAGILVPLEFPPGDMQVAKVRLDPGEMKIVEVTVPGTVALARLAFYHRFVITDVKSDERALGNGYTFSRHVRLNRSQQD